MNPPSTGLWNDPPPPGIEDEKEECMEKNYKHVTEVKSVDRTDPYVKSPQYLDYENHKHRDRHSHRRRSRSKSYERYKSRSRSRDRNRKHRSRSKRHRRSPSQSRGHYRHRSISYSRSPSYDRSRQRHKDKRRRRTSHSRRHSRSRTRSHSRSRKRHYSKLSRKSRTYSHSPTSDKNEFSDNGTNKEDKFEEDDSEAANQNAFKNDGSFLELYKKMQEEQQKVEAAKAEASASEIKIPTFGKRRGGRVLKTGVVVKNKADDENEGVEPQDPWSIYLKEVKRYKEACCDDDSKTRPLVK